MKVLGQSIEWFHGTWKAELDFGDHAATVGPNGDAKRTILSLPPRRGRRRAHLGHR